MSLNKHGVVVCCEQCRCISNDDQGGFDVRVPITASDGNVGGIARLRCTVTPACHHVELMAWDGSDTHPIEVTEEVRQRVSAALDFVAEKRICGNSEVCPAEVVRLVEDRAKE